MLQSIKCSSAVPTTYVVHVHVYVRAVECYSLERVRREYMYMYVRT